jgi:hypothetical protein
MYHADWTGVPAREDLSIGAPGRVMDGARGSGCEFIEEQQAMVTVAQYPQMPRAILIAMKKTLLGLVLLFCFAVPYAAQAQVVIVVHHRHHHHHHHPYNRMNLGQ